MGVANISGNILTDSGTNLSSLVSGSGTTNYLPKFTGASTIGNSQIQDDGTSVGIGGSPNASYKLAVTGNTLGTGTAFDFFTSSGIGSSGVTGLLRVVTAGTSTGIAIGQANSSRYTAIQPNEHIIYNDDFFMRTNGAFPLSLGTNNTIRMTITSSGITQINGTNGAVRLSLQNTDNTGYLAFTEQEIKMWRPDGSGANLNIATQAISGSIAGSIIFSPLNTERMRITSGGKVCINTTSSNNGWLSVQGAYGAAAIDARGSAGEWTYYGIASSTSGSSNGLLLFAGTTSADVAVLIKNQSGSSEYFQIRGDGLILSPSTYNVTTASAANMNIGTAGDFRRSTASSIRFKENIIDWDGNGLDTILALKPKTFTYKEDYYSEPNRQFLGLIAEEVAEVSSYLADFENEDGSGQVENVRYANIVVPLIKAIQELSAKVTALENK